MGLPMAAVGGLGFQIGRGIPIGKGEDEVVWAGGGGRFCVGPDWIGVCLGKRSFQVRITEVRFSSLMRKTGYMPSFNYLYCSFSVPRGF
jgi:hypothetical protein